MPILLIPFLFKIILYFITDRMHVELHRWPLITLITINEADLNLNINKNLVNLY